MKKLVLLLVLGLVSAFGLIGASPALAGNCTNINAGNVFYAGPTGGTAFKGFVGSCSGVARIEFGEYVHTNNGYVYDITAGNNYEYDGGWTGAAVQTTCNGCAVRWVQWWEGGSRFCLFHPGQNLVQTNFSYRIQSIDPKGGLSWGQWHWVLGSQSYYNCG